MFETLTAIEKLIAEAKLEKEQDIPILARNVFLHHFKKEKERRNV